MHIGCHRFILHSIKQQPVLIRFFPTSEVFQELQVVLFIICYNDATTSDLALLY